MANSEDYFEYEVTTNSGVKETVAFLYGEDLSGEVFEEASKITAGDAKMYFILRKAAKTPKDYKKLISCRQKVVNEFQKAYTDANNERSGIEEDN